MKAFRDSNSAIVEQKCSMVAGQWLETFLPRSKPNKKQRIVLEFIECRIADSANISSLRSIDKRKVCANKANLASLESDLWMSP